MAACASGASTASAVISSAIEPTAGWLACTATCTSGVLSFLAQPAAASTRVSCTAVIHLVIEARFGICFACVVTLESSCQSLKVGQRCLIAKRAVVARILRGGKNILRIDDFEHRGLASAVAELGEAQAFGSCFGAGVERCELIAGGSRLRVELLEVGDQTPLSRAQRDLHRVSAYFALLDLVLRREPVPDRYIYGDTCGVAQVAHRFGSFCGELRRVDTVGEVEPEIWQVGGAGSGHIRVAFLQAGQGPAQLRIILACRSLNVGFAGERRRVHRRLQRVRGSGIG